MNEVAIFGAEVLASVLVSAFIVIRLQGLLRRIGAEICPRGAGNTEFWVTYTQLMMFIAPLILVAFISRAESAPEMSAVAQLKSSLLIVLIGQFAGLVLVGRAVWKSIIAPATVAAAATPVAAAATAGGAS
jgi:hypothetical protein